MRAELNDPEAVTVEPPHPRLGQPSITEAGDDAAGRLSVQARVEADGLVGLFDDVVGGAWQLIGLDADPMADVPANLRTWFADLGGTATASTVDGGVRDIDGAYRAWFEGHGCSSCWRDPISTSMELALRRMPRACWRSAQRSGHP